ncbi:hypothetical protein QQS21_007090 [Conoideocrella luteorostrata]|uniref:PNPLA domain-containing protein n=1 Tax=Conoideocrella luteorostrata TaxID=1105319 RepID=A0AAJ0FZR5_9HYPO|nr:hypothetical protein QQS21_007090 [Conoideocrella luteorostrata]
MEAALKKVFGSSRKICDWSPGTEMGFHIGMPVTSTDDASTYLITNYNGAGKRAEDSDYYILRALDEGGDVPLWQALRATTAAPYFFAPQEIEGKTYQDGGIVEYNNPAALACAETAVIFPETPLPSIVASFGTGSAGPKRETMASRSLKSKGQLGTRRVTKSRKQVRGRKLSDRFASRIFQAFLSQGDSNRAWKQLLSKREVHGSGGFFRFDVQYEGSVPSLDSIADLDEMEEIAEECITTSPALDKLALCLRAHNFYFELDKEPEYVDGQYECTGNIYCLLESDSEEREVFFSSLHHSSSVFQVCSRTVPGDFLASTDTRLDDEFSRNIKFSVPERQTPFEITLKEGAEDACGISGSPFTIDQLVKVQKLDAWFGTGDHRQ